MRTTVAFVLFADVYSRREQVQKQALRARDVGAVAKPIEVRQPVPLQSASHTSLRSPRHLRDEKPETIDPAPAAAAVHSVRA